MACRVTKLCTLCYSCVEVCPKRAILEEPGCIRIDAARCNECAGHRVGPRCMQICPQEGAIEVIKDSGAAV